jgi:hypothetical protein
MRDSWDYIEARLADQRATADRRRRVAQARARNGSSHRLGGLLRSRAGRSENLGGCR